MGARLTGWDGAGIRADVVRMATPVVTRVTRRILSRSAILCPVDTGRLRAAGRMRVSIAALGPRGIVEYPVSYAAAVHDGSGPHVIRAKKKRALKFQMDGRTVIVRSVRHPGTVGRPFLAKAAMNVAAGEGLRWIPRSA